MDYIQFMYNYINYIKYMYIYIYRMIIMDHLSPDMDLEVSWNRATSKSSKSLDYFFAILVLKPYGLGIPSGF